MALIDTIYTMANDVASGEPAHKCGYKMARTCSAPFFSSTECVWMNQHGQACKDALAG